GQSIIVSKHGLEKDAVAEVIASPDGGWEDDIISQLHSLVEAAITDKARKLRGRVPPPWVLLLLDRYHFARPNHYAAVRASLEASAGKGGPAEEFHAIFIVDNAGLVFALYPSRKLSPST